MERELIADLQQPLIEACIAVGAVLAALLKEASKPVRGNVGEKLK